MPQVAMQRHPAAKARVTVRGGLPTTPHRAVRLGPPPATRRIIVTVAVRRPADVHRVTAFAGRHGLTVVRASRLDRLVELTGTLRQFSTAFRVRFVRVRHQGIVYRALRSPATVPASLGNAIDYVHGLKTVPAPRARRTATGRVVLRGALPRRMPGVRRLGRSPGNRRIRVTLFVRAAADFPRLEVFAGRHGLTVAATCRLQRTMILRGRIADFSRAFGVRLYRDALRGHMFRGVIRAASAPPAIGNAIVYIHNLRTTPNARWAGARRPRALM